LGVKNFLSHFGQPNLRSWGGLADLMLALPAKAMQPPHWAGAVCLADGATVAVAAAAAAPVEPGGGHPIAWPASRCSLTRSLWPPARSLAHCKLAPLACQLPQPRPDFSMNTRKREGPVWAAGWPANAALLV